MLRILLSLSLTFLILGCNPNTVDHEASVRASFDGYRQSVLDGDGAAAANFVDSNTIDYYGKMRSLALDAEPLVLNDLSTVDKLMVVMLRHQIDNHALREMTSRSLFAYAVDQGWISRDSVITNELGKITIQGGHASGVHMPNGKHSSLSWIFRLENGEWKMDITSIFPAVDQVMKAMIRESGLSENDFLFSIVESASGKKVPENIWQPKR